ncbi:MAG TPA: hypothetical protein VFP35_03365 [Candidatus Saccharimonadales bacterium]|nr:hypothetical protein [Candidatus Saccharimonadales bacterium]
MAKPGQPSFKADSAEIKTSGGRTYLEVAGRRTGRPNKRFTLNTAELKILAAKIEYIQKNKVTEQAVSRINYLPTMSQTRIHTAGLVFPGEYRLKLEIHASGLNRPPELLKELFV